MNTLTETNTYVAFAGDRMLHSGPLTDVLAATKLASPDVTASVLFFENETGTQVDFDLRGTLDEVLERVRTARAGAAKVGRPKLGVESREVSLLPRHWEWLQQQPSAVSATLRKLVEAEMRRSQPEQTIRAKRDAAYKIMSAVAGNKPNFEEASRALYAGDVDKFGQLISEWPEDVRNYLAAAVIGTAPSA